MNKEDEREGDKIINRWIRWYTEEQEIDCSLRVSFVYIMYEIDWRDLEYSIARRRCHHLNEEKIDIPCNITWQYTQTLFDE